MLDSRNSIGPFAHRLNAGLQDAATIATSRKHDDFVELVRKETPWRLKESNDPETYLRNVEHHLRHFVPRLLASVDREVRRVFDFGCGSGGSSISLAMVFPEARFHGIDINPTDVAIGRARAELFGVSDRCQFDVVQEGAPFPVPDGAFDLCICCSVLEYVMAPDARRRCVQEMVRALSEGGLLFISVPNRIYPLELHSRRWGANWFPKLLKARAVGSSMWEVKALARPYVLKPYRTPSAQLFTPWTNFCLQRTGGPTSPRNG